MEYVSYALLNAKTAQVILIIVLNVIQDIICTYRLVLHFAQQKHIQILYQKHVFNVILYVVPVKIVQIAQLV